jgi:hypothetical protein
LDRLSVISLPVPSKQIMIFFGMESLSFPI